MSQQYSLRWNNHQPNFISMFTTLLNTQTLVDVTLAAEGKHLQAHKVVLSACSTYFQALFVDNPSRHPIVILKDVTFADLRTMVDFMYYGEVNVTEEQLPQVLDTAKLLKIKGLTEMPDSTSLTRAQGGGSAADFQQPPEPAEPLRMSSPATSPSVKRRRRRKSSTGSTSLNMVGEEARADDSQTVELVRDGITLSSVPQRRRDFHDERHQDTSQQTPDNPHNLNMDPLGVEHPAGMAQGGQWSMMEHAYPRYSNTCGLGGGLQGDAGLYMNNVMHPHMEGELGEYGTGLGVAHASPGPSCAVEPLQSQEPPPLAQPKRRRTTNPQSEENFQRALEAVRFGGIGFCKAARMFGVNNRTLWLEYKKKGYPNNRPSIKSRIKREHTTPPPDHKDEPPAPEQQMALLCPPHPVSVGFIESRPIDFPLQGVPTVEQFVAGLEELRRSKLFQMQCRVPEKGMLRQTSDSSERDSNATARRRVPTVEQLVAGLEELQRLKLFQMQCRVPEKGMLRQTSDSSERDSNATARRRVPTVEQFVAGLEELRLSKLSQKQSRVQEEDMQRQTSDSSERDSNATARRRVTTVEQFVAGLKLRRSKLFKRQGHVPEEGIRRQMSEPIAGAPPAAPALRKHDSYPQYTANKNRRGKSREHDTIGSVVIRAVAMGAASSAEEPPRASHTPAVRSGPPLSCNFCWNTVDDCGRILRRKTQYHCPECRTNLCIVPCFHEYHEAETELASNVR